VNKTDLFEIKVIKTFIASKIMFHPKEGLMQGTLHYAQRQAG